MAYVHDNIEGINVDQYVGGTIGSETVTGSDARDLVVGGSGSDVIIGGKGADIMYGGTRTFYIPAGSGTTMEGPYNFVSYYGDGQEDRFVFNAGDSGVGFGKRDVIRGFDVGIDKIDLSSMGPDLRYAFSVVGDKVLVNIDADNNGKWDMQIAVVTSYLYEPGSFSAADFILA